MAIAKIYGLESEYGVSVSYREKGGLWTSSGGLIEDVAHKLVAGPPWPLSGGRRYYDINGHPEYATPELLDPRLAPLADKAGDRLLMVNHPVAKRHVRRILGKRFEVRVQVLKNNGDGNGSTWGQHESYQVHRPPGVDGAWKRELAERIASHFVTRQIYTGAGKVGAEVDLSSQQVVASLAGKLDGRARYHDALHPAYQMSARPDFTWDAFGASSTRGRPMVTSKDESYGKHLRLHVIVGDNNRNDVAVMLKVGTTAALLAAMEDGYFNGKDKLLLADPTTDFREVSSDLSLKTDLVTAAGTTINVIDHQVELLKLARRWVASRGPEAIGGADAWRAVDEAWERVLKNLERLRGRGLDSLVARDASADIDWLARLHLIFGQLDRRYGGKWSEDAARKYGHTYDDLSPVVPDRRDGTNELVDLHSQMPVNHLFSRDEISAAMTWPPDPRTRAEDRRRVQEKFGVDAVATWDRLSLGLVQRPLYLREPTSCGDLLRERLEMLSPSGRGPDDSVAIIELPPQGL